MKKILFLLMMIAALHSKGQLLVNVQLPPNGIMQKSQLWNMTVTNTSSAILMVHIELMFSEATNLMQTMSAATQIITIPPGTTQLNNSLLQPIQYNILTAASTIDASPNGLLPVGDFEICYSLMSHPTDAVVKVAEDCQELLIEPLSPPQLTNPYDQADIEIKNPQLTWLPPLPANLFANLNYDLDLVEVSPHQSPSDAVQENIPIFHQQGIFANTLLYPVSAPPLELNNQYAWRVVAKSNEVPVSQSETWSFMVKENNKIKSGEQSELPYAKLVKENGSGYAIFVNEIKFDYLNESADSTWDLTVFDLSARGKKEIILPMDSILLKPGVNLIKYDVSDNPGFINKHLYLMEIINSRNETWRLKFEYREQNEQ